MIVKPSMKGRLAPTVRPTTVSGAGRLEAYRRNIRLPVAVSTLLLVLTALGHTTIAAEQAVSLSKQEVTPPPAAVRQKAKGPDPAWRHGDLVDSATK